MIRSVSTRKQIVIDLNGPDGNAYVMLSYAKRFAKQLGYDRKRIDKLTDDMTSGDYIDLIMIFDAHFGSVVTLETNDGLLNSIAERKNQE